MPEEGQDVAVVVPEGLLVLAVDFAVFVPDQLNELMMVAAAAPFLGEIIYAYCVPHRHRLASLSFYFRDPGFFSLPSALLFGQCPILGQSHLHLPICTNEQWHR